MIDTRQLEMFQQVVDAGSFSGAARALHCSQPAVSQQMRALERAVGGPLFVRVGRSLRLTEAGKVLARHSAAILGDLAVARRQVQAVSALDLGTVRVCAFPSANATLVPQAAALLRANSPHMRLELSEAEPPESYAHLRRAECDVAIAFHYDRPSDGRPSDGRPSDGRQSEDNRSGHDRPGANGGAHEGRRRPDHHAANGGRRDGHHGGRAEPRDDHNVSDGMVATPLLDEQWELLVPIGHRLVDHGRLDAGTPQAPVPLETLGRETWIAGCPTCRVAFSGACERAGFEPDIVCSTDDNMALQSLVAAGLGVTLVPHLVSSFLRHPRVVAMPVTPALRRHVVAYTWADLARVAAVRDTLAALRTVARDAMAGRRPHAHVDA